LTENFRKAAGVNSLDEKVAKVAKVAAELPEVHGGKVRTKAMVSTLTTLHLPLSHDGARNQKVQRQVRSISMQRTLHILKLKQRRGVRILGAAIPGTVRKSLMKWRILHRILRMETNIGVSGILIPGIMAIASHPNGVIISGSTMISGATIAVVGIRRNTRTSGMKNLRKIGDMIRQTLQTSSRILNGRLINIGIRQIPQTL